MINQSNIEIEKDDEDFVMFKTTCDCGDYNHTVSVIVETFGENDNRPLVSLYFKCGRRDQYYINDNFFQRMWKRIVDSLKVLFTGHLDLDEEFIFRDEQHLRDFRNTLEEAILQIAKKTSEKNKIQ